MNDETFLYQIQICLLTNNTKQFKKLATENSELIKNIKENIILDYSDKKNHLNFLKIIANFNRLTDTSTLVKAVDTSTEEVIKYMLDNNYPVDKRAVIHATWKNDLKITKLLLEYGCPIDCWALNWARINKSKKIRDYLEKKIKNNIFSMDDIIIHTNTFKNFKISNFSVDQKCIYSVIL